MIGSLQTGLSGLEQIQRNLEVIDNNLANANTVGYRSERTEFADALSQTLVNSSGPMQVGKGLATSPTSLQFDQGTLNPTGCPTDLAVNGCGLFVVADPDSGATCVTRNGQFKLDAEGNLVTDSGMVVQGYTGSGAPYSSESPVGNIQISAAAAIAALRSATVPAPALVSFHIDSLGQVHVALSDGSRGVIGQVLLQNVNAPQALTKQGSHLYAYSAAAGPLDTPVAPGTGPLGTIASGFLESSTVDLRRQMADLIAAQRAFEANAKVVTTSDEILQTLVNLKR
jgi:flagellar hook protein FlgE